MKKINLHKGINSHRLNNNPLEKKCAEAWAELNSHNHSEDSTLQYLLAEDPNHPDDEVTYRDRVVAATVIQWLGSPVGESFVREVLDAPRKGF